MTKGDKILILFIIVASIASIFAIPVLLNSGGSEKQVVVNIDGKEIDRFELVDSPESEFKEDNNISSEEAITIWSRLSKIFKK